ASRSSTDRTTGALVAEPDRYAHNPTAPDACNTAVESELSNSHAAGSAVPDFHTLAARAVVPAPDTWNRTCSPSPAATVTPGTVATVWITASEPATTRTN